MGLHEGGQGRSGEWGFMEEVKAIVVLHGGGQGRSGQCGFMEEVKAIVVSEASWRR